jgi:hypothetical protein
MERFEEARYQMSKAKAKIVKSVTVETKNLFVEQDEHKPHGRINLYGLKGGKIRDNADRKSVV